MNRKEVNEIKRRLTLDKCSITRVYGCFVNKVGEVVAKSDVSLGLMPQSEKEEYIALLRKALSGSHGKNLLDMEFSTQQVLESPEHKLLTELKKSKLENEEARESFFAKVTENLSMEDRSYLILLAYDAYDVPCKSRDGEDGGSFESDTVFSYILCAVCPVKDGKTELGYFASEKEFHACTSPELVANPELGFMFPAFDERRSNIYAALYYTKDASSLHSEFVTSVFGTEPPMSAAEQQETFGDVLCEALEEDCSLEVVQTVHEQICERIAEYKETKDPELQEFTVKDIGAMLAESGVGQERIEAFKAKCTESFGDDAPLLAENIIDSKKFEIKTPQVRISIPPEFSYVVETRMIDGRNYLLIPADEGVEVNGVDVSVKRKSDGDETEEEE